MKKQHGFDNVIHLELGMDFNEYIPENKLVYLTPTTFMNRDFILEIIKLNFEEFIANVVLDEVHCISNWSHDFRPEYLMLSFNLNYFVDKVRFLCFTATADYTVVKDLQNQLDIRPEDVHSNIEIKKNKYCFKFCGCSSQGEIFSKTIYEIENFLRKTKFNNKKALVLTKNREISKALHRELSEDYRVYVDVFNPDLPSSYEDFAKGKYNVLIADSDLGIGINLPDITDIIHLGLPVSKSQFVQEIGRAGRKQDDARSIVLFLEKDAYSSKNRIFLHRDTPIEQIVALLKKTKQNDINQAFAKIFGGIEEQDEYYNGIISLYDKLRMVEKHTELRLHTNPREPYNQQVSKYMRHLYVLYRIGFVINWYIVSLNEEDNCAIFYIDFKEKKPEVKDVIQKTVDYLHVMGDYKREISSIKSAKSIEEVIGYYVDWHYHQFLYHHREQLLEMLDFLEAYKERDASQTVEALSNHFSLSLLEIEQDSDRANMLTIKDATALVLNGVDSRMIDNIRKSNENEYSTKLDYLLFLYNIVALNSPDISRFERVLGNLNEIEFNETLEQVGAFYNRLNPRNKIFLINSLCKRTTLKQTIDAIYSKVQKDTVFYGILALCANSKWGHQYV